MPNYLLMVVQLEARIGIGFGQTAGPVQGPAAAVGQVGDLESYWQFVRENPLDFNGWVYLVQVTRIWLKNLRNCKRTFL